MKRKILGVLIVIILIITLISLTGCGNNSSEKNRDSGTSSSNMQDVELYPVKDEETDMFGYVDNKGKWVIEPKYESASGFNPETGLAKVWTSNKGFDIGFINKKGELVIEDKYGRGTSSFYNGYAVVETENKGGSGTKTYYSKMIIDKDQNIIIPDGKYIEMTDVSKNGLVGVVYDAGMQYIKLDGTLAFDKKFGSNGTGFNANGIAAVETTVLSNSYILIDEQGNQIGDKTYGEITKLNDNNYGFAHNIDGYAIINGNGEFLSEHIYEYTSEFNNSNIAMVKTENKNKWHLINNEGKEINDNTYKSYTLLLDGKWVVTLDDGKHQILNADGSILVDTF